MTRSNCWPKALSSWLMRSRNLDQGHPHDPMKTRLSRQLEGAASRESSDSSRMFYFVHTKQLFKNSYIVIRRNAPISVEVLDQHHPQHLNRVHILLWLTIVWSQTKSVGFWFGQAYVHSWNCCAFRESPWKPANHGILFNVRLWLRIFRQLQAKGHPFPPIFRDILSDIMPVAGVLSDEVWQNCANVTWYRNG